VTDLEKWLELERLEYMGEIEPKRKTLEESIRQIKADRARHGMLRSGVTVRSIDDVWDAYRKDLVATQISIRKKFAAHAPDLLSDNELNHLQEDLGRSLRASFQAARDQLERESAATGQSPPLQREYREQTEVSRLVAGVRREIVKLKLQRDLGVKEQPRGNVVLNIGSSTIVGLSWRYECDTGDARGTGRRKVGNCFERPLRRDRLR
jgi:hypothetical protein